MTLLAELLSRDPSLGIELDEYHFLETKDPVMIREVFRQRHGVYAFERYIDPDLFPDGTFRDEFDDVAAHIAAVDAFGSVVGSSRVVPPSPLGLPTHRLFRLPQMEIDPQFVGEVGRLAITPSHRGRALSVATGLIAGIYRALRSRGLQHFLAFMHPALIRMLNGLRIPVRPICELEPGAEQEAARGLMSGYFGRARVRPTLCSLDEMDRALGL